MKDALFDLINSLTRSEKRYFKLFASRHTIGEENNYVTLFNYIERQPYYNEDSIFQKFKGETFLNNFSITKKRLYDNILSALDAFHVGNSEEAQLLRQLHAAEILMEKSLIDQSIKIILSVEKQAVKKANQLLLQKIFRLKTKFQNELGLDKSFLKGLQSDFQTLHSIQHNEVVFLQLNKAYSEQKLTHRVLIDLPKEEAITTIENKLLYHHLVLLQAWGARNRERITAQTMILEDLYGSNSELQENYLPHFLELKHIALTNALKQKQWEYANKQMHSIREAKVNQEHQRFLHSLYVNICSLELALAGEQKAKLEEIVSQVLTTSAQQITSIHLDLQKELLIKIAEAHLHLKQFNKALGTVNQYLQMNESNGYDEMTSELLVLDCIIHFEMQHYDYLNYAIKNTNRFLKSKNITSSHCKSLLQLLVKLAIASKIEQEDILYDFSKKWKKAHEEPQYLFINFDHWLNAKILQLH